MQNYWVEGVGEEIKIACIQLMSRWQTSIYTEKDTELYCL